MKCTLQYYAYPLKFKKAAGTSRGWLTHKPCFLLALRDESRRCGWGECSLLPGLSRDDVPDFEDQLAAFCAAFNHDNSIQPAAHLPSLQFAFEQAWLDFENGGSGIVFPSDFTEGKHSLRINGLVWMGDANNMWQQAVEKVEQGFGCLKFKVGALDFENEWELLQKIRAKYPADLLEIRLDANGAWSPDLAKKRLDQLARLHIHSLEQPIAAGQTAAMADICKNSPIPIALDEELLTQNGKENQLLTAIKPAYIILKPGLLGGFTASNRWLRAAEDLGIGWWATSALEGNVGLSAIAQWTAHWGVNRPQGLGTGSLYTRNLSTALYLTGESLFFKPDFHFDPLPQLN